MRGVRNGIAANSGPQFLRSIAGWQTGMRARRLAGGSRTFPDNWSEIPTECNAGESRWVIPQVSGDSLYSG